MASNYDSFWEGYNWNIEHKNQEKGLPVFGDLCRDASDDSIWVCYPPHEKDSINLISQKPRDGDNKRTVPTKDFLSQYQVL